METLPKIPDGYITMGELIEIAEISCYKVHKRLKEAGVPEKVIRILGEHRCVRIYPHREALYAVLDE